MMNEVFSTLLPSLVTSAFAAKFAIWPIKVSSPVNITIPFPVPYLFNVEKNAIFFVYVFGIRVSYLFKWFNIFAFYRNFERNYPYYFIPTLIPIFNLCITNH